LIDVHSTWFRRGGIDRSVRLRNPALASASRSMMARKSRSERGSGSSFHTTSTSPLAELIQEPMQFGAVLTPAGRFLAIDTLASRRLERDRLRGGFLLVSGDPSVAHQHCAKLSPMLFATR
jgi:hypothetical protein